ncbi:phenylalanyl-tRNA synthetase alpha subunit [Clostridium beijerinckii]|nr:phenylalanyl-tRNA synthetase alpha subunit [Clostridium beijerinckii]NYC82093.1 phenylalanyl-tRNA synthetase alpha subunit [Clostridium beijerinckii]
MKEKLKELQELALSKIEAVKTSSELEEIRVKFLGKKGELTTILRGMGNLSPEERPIVGKLVNEAKAAVEEKLESVLKAIKDKEKAEKLAGETIDISLPGRKKVIGKRHPLDLTLQSMEEIFVSMGFTIEDGPEVEYDHYNFEALNIPKDHPARSEQDTLYINDKIVLRTQTSPIQVRTMENQKPPIKMISPGKVYRSDSVDATHSPIFYQMEGLVIDKGVTFADLKGTLELFAKKNVWRQGSN